MNTKQISEDALALKRVREFKEMSRKQAAILLGTSYKSVEKFENGRTTLSPTRIEQILTAYDTNYAEFVAIREGKDLSILKKPRQKPKVIENNHLRRNYKKIITKEVKTLVVLRRLRGINQYEASNLCGYSKATIGHIENGRIELPEKRIRHIIQSYGFTIKQFIMHKNSDVFVTDIQDECIKIIQKLSIEKLNAVHPLLKSFI